MPEVHDADSHEVDTMNTIYTVTSDNFPDRVLEGFATDEEEIKQIIRNHYRKQGKSIQPVWIYVNIKHKEVTMYFTRFRYEGNVGFTIHTVEGWLPNDSLR